MTNILIIILGSFLLAPTPASAFWRLICHGRLGVARIDPIVSYGNVSQHAHVVHGAQNIGFTSTGQTLRQSSCTSCAVAQDRSAYWTPALYFQHDNGTFQIVDQVGGMTAYYFTNETSDPFNMTAFPMNFRMIAGDFRKRNFSGPVPDPEMSFWQPSDMTQQSLGEKALGFNCLHYNETDEASLQYHYLRNKAFLDERCYDGIRLELMFPSCWNGVDLDSSDHKSHVNYPNLMKYGECPPTHPVKLPILFYETIWNTYQFKDLPGQFTLAQGDPTGYGYHGDFISGWNATFLQNAINTCTNSSGNQEDCAIFELQDDDVSTSCKLDVPVALENEAVTGQITSLPGNVPIQYGPGYATMGPGVQPTRVNPIIISHPTNVSFSNVSNIATSFPGPSMKSTTFSPTTSSALNSSVTISVSSASSSNVDIVLTPPPSISGEVAYFTSTSTFTSAGVEVILVVVEEVTTVTILEPSTAAASKRHIHRHAGNSRHF